MPPLLQHDARAGMRHTSALPPTLCPLHPPSQSSSYVSHTLALPFLSTGGFIQFVRVGICTAQDASPSLSSATHARSLSHHATLRQPRLLLWVLCYLMAGPTCHQGDVLACPIHLLSPAGTSWLDRLHADR